jgi:PAS domain-containing protein
MGFDWVLGLTLLLSACVAAMVGAWFLAFLLGTGAKGRAGGADPSAGTAFVFDGETLLDASPSGRALLAASSVPGNPYQRLVAFLAPRFPGVEERLASLPQAGRLALSGIQGQDDRPISLLAEWQGGLSRITVVDPDAEGMISMTDPLTLRAMEEELQLLRATVAHAPLAIWLENGSGDIVWANTGYMTLARELLGPDQDFNWPLPRLMKLAGPGRQRVRAGTANWFDVTAHPADDGQMVFAQPIDTLIAAEGALRDFTQTLTKTFAHLPIGLAVFDKDRQLALFNPALLDLTGLPPDFLASRPMLFHVLDRMRDEQMIPEPKDYLGWRQRIIDLEKQAAAGLYMETWNLPGGQTYRVIARPHPDGALAMLFEDISTEMSRTRRFRADLEMGQSVVDAMDEAVAVFSAAGSLVMTNVAYSELWSHDPACTVTGESGIGTLADYWRAHTAPSTIWAEAEDFVASLDQRNEVSGEARLSDGRLLSCRFVPLAGGATMIAFRIKPPEDPFLLEPVFRRALAPA